MVKVVFKFEGQKKEIECKVGDNLLEVAHSNDIPLVGACEASLACSTCHVVVDKKWFEKLEEFEEAEEDMLEMAYGLEETSRLGCQIIMTEELDGIEVTIPEENRNLV